MINQGFLVVFQLTDLAGTRYSDSHQNRAQRERKMAWKKNYSTVRNASWIWYLLAAFCFMQAVTSVTDNGGQFGPAFFMWVAGATGLAFSAGLAKRKAAAKVGA